MSAASQPVPPGTGLSTTAIAAIATGIGVSLICIIALIVLLVRAIQSHKRLLADLEERGVSIAQARGEARNSVTKPRAVLKRNTTLPYNKNSGWGTLTSVETIKSADAAGTVAHYVPPKPTEAMKKGSRLSWPFHTRRVSGHNINLKRMKTSRLSTVLEDPKPSAMVPILHASHHNASRPSLSVSQHSRHSQHRLSRPSSSQSLLQYHPAFRNSSEEHEYNAHARPASFFRTSANDRLQRAKSFADVPTEPPERPQLRARSASMSGSLSGNAPDVILPPLPLDIERIKSEATRRNQLRRVPSKMSESSLGSVDTSILATQASPLIPLPEKRRPQKITKPRTRGGTSTGGRPFRDSLDLRAKVLSLRKETPNTSPARTYAATPETKEHWPGTQHNIAEVPTPPQDFGDDVRKSILVITNGTASPPVSPAKTESPSTPKRKLRTQMYSEGSPERQKRHAGKGFNGARRSPKRQHSQASSRSSGGNPFQWDPTPLSSTGKPSALKGSPSARQGHRRKNSVRISLVPTFHGPPTRSPSPSFLVQNKENTTEGASEDKPDAGLGLAISSPRALPTPPSSSTFAPELKFPTTSLRASLTETSPTLALVGYDQSYVVFPTDHVLNQLSKMGGNRTSTGSIVSLSRFPGTPSIAGSVEDDTYQKTTRECDLYDFSRDFQMPETPYLSQYPFRPETPEEEHSLSLSNFADVYNAEQPGMVFQTPVNTFSRTWQSAFAAIPEESSVSSQKTASMSSPRVDDSPPVSPKDLSPPRFGLNDRSAYNLPVYATTIPEETPETIDPAILSKDTFMMLNSWVNNTDGSIMGAPRKDSMNLALSIPKTPDFANTTFDAQLEAAFPFDVKPANASESPVLGHRQSQTSSVYSLPSPLESLSPISSLVELPSPVMPCSPRPAHAELPTAAPTLAIDFSDMPKLTPSPQGPRRSPPKPLRTSIAALRRMNSDATKARKEKAGRGERRYLRLGREDSVALAGDESWLDELDDATSVELDEAEGRRLVGSVLDEFDEGCTVLDLDDGSTMLSTSTITPDTDFTNPTEHEDATTGAQERSSSIWDDGEKFWSSYTPPRPDSPTKLKERYQPMASSPLASPALTTSSTRTIKPVKKRDFEVAKDSSPSPSPCPSPTEKHRKGRKKRRESGERGRKKRDALGNATPNVRIQVTSPSGRIMMTPGSFYDEQGFLRY
jgi:hypothetical protein